MEKETKLSITMLYPHLKAKIPKDLMGPSFTVMVNGVNQCRFVNGDTYSDLSTYEQIERCYDKPMFNPDDKRCPTCRKEIGYP